MHFVIFGDPSVFSPDSIIRSTSTATPLGQTAHKTAIKVDIFLIIMDAVMCFVESYVYQFSYIQSKMLC